MDNKPEHFWVSVSCTGELVTSSALEAVFRARSYPHSTSQLGAVGAAQTFSYRYGMRAHGGCSVTAPRIVKVNWSRSVGLQSQLDPLKRKVIVRQSCSSVKDIYGVTRNHKESTQCLMILQNVTWSGEVSISIRVFRLKFVEFLKTNKNKNGIYNTFESWLFLYRLIFNNFYYHNSRHYPSSSLLFKTRRFGDWILSLSPCGAYSVGPASRDRDYLYLLGRTELVPSKDGDRIRSPKLRVLNKRQDDG
jgi:hypothetical protein